MKKALGLCVALMLMASITPLAFADEAEDSTDAVEIDAETQKQVEVMNNWIGSEIRLLQLEKSITLNIFRGEQIVSNLTDLGFNTTELEAILVELEFVKEEVIAADPNATDAVQIFVDLKYDAVNLTKEFRETLKEILDDDAIEQLRERVREMVCEQNQNLSKNIQNKIMQFNRNQLHRVYQIAGENGDSVLNQYQNGTLTMNQVKQQIQNMITQMTKEQRYGLFYQLKQGIIQNQIQANNCVQNASEGFYSRQENRLQQRLQKSENMSDNPVNEETANRIRDKISDIGKYCGGSDDNNPGNGYYGDNGNQQSGSGHQ